MNRYVPLLVVLPLLAASACMKKNGDDKDVAGGGGEPGAGEPGAPTGEPGEGPPGDELNGDPLKGIQPPKAILETGAFSDGPVWHAGLGVLFFTTPLGAGALFRMLPDGRVLKVRDGVRELGTTPISTTVTASGELITVEMKQITRFNPDPAVPNQPVVVSAGWNSTDPLVPGTFDTLNDAVMRPDGTMYVTDPGYFAEPHSNKIYRITPNGQASIVEAFEDVPRPNGIALSPDQKTLYVGFTRPMAGTLPFIRQYIVNDDGTLGEWTKFVDVGPEDSTPDGLAVDEAGNVYVAVKGGIEVFKADASKIGRIEVPEKPTGVAFGGKDMKTLYITTEGVKLWEVRVNVPGIAQ